MLNKLSKFELLASVFLLLGGAGLITYLISSVKSYYPIFTDMIWQGWALLFVLVGLSLAVILSTVLFLGASAFRKIKPLPIKDTLGLKVHTYYVTPLHPDQEGFENMIIRVSLGARVWSNGALLYISDAKLKIIKGKKSYDCFNRGVIFDENNIEKEHYEHGNTMLDADQTISSRPTETLITFVSELTRESFSERNTIVFLSIESTTGEVAEHKISIKDL